MHINNQSQTNTKNHERDAAIQIITTNSESDYSVLYDSLVSAAWLIAGCLLFLAVAAPTSF